LSEIKRLKDEVNQVRRERVMYDRVFKKLEVDLKSKEDDLVKSLTETLQVENEK